MKRRIFASLFLALAFAGTFTTTGSSQNRELDFNLENRTGVNIYSIYIASHDSDEWGEDLLTSDILRDGEDIDIVFHPKAGSKLWDLRIEDKDGGSVEWEALDPTKFEVLTLKIVKGKPVAEWK